MKEFFSCFTSFLVPRSKIAAALRVRQAVVELDRATKAAEAEGLRVCLELGSNHQPAIWVHDC